MKIYIAAASSDRFWARLVMREVQNRGYEVHDWTVNPNYKKQPHEVDGAKILADNLAAVQESHGVIWLCSETKSVGAGQEALAAQLLGIPLVIIPVCKYVCPSRVDTRLEAANWFDDTVQAIEWIEKEIETQAVGKPLF